VWHESTQTAQCQSTPSLIWVREHLAQRIILAITVKLIFLPFAPDDSCKLVLTFQDFQSFLCHWTVSTLERWQCTSANSQTSAPLSDSKDTSAKKALWLEPANQLFANRIGHHRVLRCRLEIMKQRSWWIAVKIKTVRINCPAQRKHNFTVWKCLKCYSELVIVTVRIFLTHYSTVRGKQDMRWHKRQTGLKCRNAQTN